MAIKDEAVFPEDPGLSWAQLRAFFTCARLRSFNGAARAMTLTSSAVRYQIGLLEHRLGGRLFERSGGALTLTNMGASFAAKVEGPMRELMAACADVTASADDEAMTLTAPPLFARQFLFGSQLQAWCDANRVELEITDIQRDLFAPEPLAAIRLAAVDHPELCRTKLLSVSVIIAASAAIAKHARPTDPEWWAQQVLICSSIRDAGWLRAWSALGLSEPKPLRTYVYSSYASALEAAASERGIVLAPLPLAQPELTSGRLRQISNVRLSTKYDYFFVMRKGPASSKRGRALRARVLSAVVAQTGAARSLG